MDNEKQYKYNYKYGVFGGNHEEIADVKALY